MNIALITIIALNLISFGVACGKHGERKEGTHNANYSFTALCITLTLYYFAFKNCIL